MTTAMFKIRFHLKAIFAFIVMAAIGSCVLSMFISARMAGRRADVGATEEAILRDFEAADFAVVEEFT